MAIVAIGAFPLLSVIFGLLAFFIGYAIAVGKDHVDAWLPFISDCGARTPESNIFGQLLNISSLFLVLTIYYIYRNVVVFYEQIEGRRLGSWKIFAFGLMILGWFATLGESMVANFQESQQLIVHDVGAFTFFIGITLYFWGQIVIGYALRPRIMSIHLTNFRLVTNLCITAMLIFHMVCLFANPFVTAKDSNGKNIGADETKFPYNIARYNSSSPYYNNHLATTISEWVLALLMQLFVLTYTFEFAYTQIGENITISERRPDPHANGIQDEIPIYKAYQPSMTLPVDNMVRPEYAGSIATRRLPRIDINSGVYEHSIVGTGSRSQFSKSMENFNQYQYY